MNSPLSKHYDLENARQLAGFAAAAYDDELTPGGARLCRVLSGSDQGSTESQPTVIENASTDTLAAIYQVTEHDTVVAFRGTRSLENFVTDVRCKRVPLFPGAKAEVHQGFKQAFDSIRAPLDDAICSRLSRQNQDGDIGRLWFTGHSLGGALAKLAALRFASASTSVYTFGEPRVGNAAFRDLYNSQLGDRTFRVVDGEDFITRIPWLLGEYRHSGIEVFYDCQGRPHMNPPWWTKGLSDVFGTWEEWNRDGRISLLADHHINRYISLLAKVREQRSEVSDQKSEISLTSDLRSLTSPPPPSAPTP